MDRRSHLLTQIGTELRDLLATIRASSGAISRQMAGGETETRQLSELTAMVERSGELIGQLVEGRSRNGGVATVGLDGEYAKARNALEETIGQLRTVEDCARVIMMDLLGRLQETTQVARAYQSIRIELADKLA